MGLVAKRESSEPRPHEPLRRGRSLVTGDDRPAASSERAAGSTRTAVVVGHEEMMAATATSLRPDTGALWRRGGQWLFLRSRSDTEKKAPTAMLMGTEVTSQTSRYFTAPGDDGGVDERDGRRLAWSFLVKGRQRMGSRPAVSLVCSSRDSLALADLPRADRASQDRP